MLERLTGAQQRRLTDAMTIVEYLLGTEPLSGSLR